MTQTIQLRRWQQAALDAFDANQRPDFLAVATPGAGKTTFALCAAARHLSTSPWHRVIVVAPTSHLKLQWAKAAARFGIELDHTWSPSDAFADDVHGVATTYAQVARNPAAFAAHAAGAFVILDEVHHAGDDKSWGAAVVAAFKEAPLRLSLSGTPFRSDTCAIPFVRYDNDLACADYAYGYDDALADHGVVRPVHFLDHNGSFVWDDRFGNTVSASFGDALDPISGNQRLRTALSMDGMWLPSVLSSAHDRLAGLRIDQPDAGGMVVATSQDHARHIARWLRENCRTRVEVVLSDDPEASSKLERFATSTIPWLVAVRMVSEGVDIPRLRLGVFATTTTTELFFRQVVGRFVRHTRGAEQTEQAYMFIPGDHRLVGHAATLAEMRRHSLRGHWEDGQRPEIVDDPTAFDRVERDAEQMSLFAPVSAELDHEAASATHARVFESRPAPAVLSGRSPQSGSGFAFELPDVTRPGTLKRVFGTEPGGAEHTATVSQRKKTLRQRNSELARTLSLSANMSHAQVNAALNQAVGIVSVARATLEQLECRAVQAERWIGA